MFKIHLFIAQRISRQLHLQPTITQQVNIRESKDTSPANVSSRNVIIFIIPVSFCNLGLRSIKYLSFLQFQIPVEIHPHFLQLDHLLYLVVLDLFIHLAKFINRIRKQFE
ncbi:hypothetical protein Hanom_Chr09g00866381 [Helianthus anomalus]